MLYTSHQGYAMLARLASTYLSFVFIYVQSWLAMGAVVATLMFEQTSASIITRFWHVWSNGAYTVPQNVAGKLSQLMMTLHFGL
jgi:hypothetical protein